MGITCAQCGTINPPEVYFCVGCGRSLRGTPPEGYGVSGTTMPITFGGPGIYAGFWPRVAAAFLDGLILTPVVLIALAILGAVGFGLALGSVGGDVSRLKGEDAASVIGALGVIGIGLFQMVFVILYWLYHAMMEASHHQGSLGKLALGIKVTDMAGERLTFWRATGRHWCKMITGMTMGIGYLMAAFTERRQCLHDLIAGCVVLNKRAL